MHTSVIPKKPPFWGGVSLLLTGLYRREYLFYLPLYSHNMDGNIAHIENI